MITQVNLSKARIGDIVLFEGRGLEFKLLSPIIWLCEPVWREWKRKGWLPWHMAILWIPEENGWKILEAVSQGVSLNYYSNEELKQRTRIYRIMPEPPGSQLLFQFLAEHLGKRYDVAIHPFTALQYLARHYINRRLPLVLDDRYSCWELGDEFADECHVSWAGKYDCALITDFMKRVTLCKPK